MKFLKLFLFLTLLMSFTTYSQTSYCNGWKNGYKEGYCYQKIGCVTPYVPICPVPNVGEMKYKDGYNRGFLKGKSDNSVNSSSSNNSRYPSAEDNTFIKFRPVKTNYGGILLDYARRRNKRRRNNKSHNTESSYNTNNSHNTESSYNTDNSRNSDMYKRFREHSYFFFKMKEYKNCIYYYENSKDLGFYDSGFEYMIAGAYFRLWKQTKKYKYKSKTRNMLELSKKHGNKQASKDLKILNELFKKY